MFPSNSLSDIALPPRRRFLQQAGLGFGSLALASLLHQDTLAAPAATVDPLAPKPGDFPAKVKSIIWLFMTGAPSQVDTWDYKPELQKRDGQELAGADPKTGFFSTSGKCLKSPFEWKQYGDSGSWVSDLFPHLSQHVDKMCFLHSMYLRQNNHAPASIELMCGTNRPGLPAMGAWMTYGLGSMNQDLPSFVVMHDTRPRGDDQIWSAGFLPKSYQALALDARRKEAIDNLARGIKHSDDQQRSQLELLRRLNQEHAATPPDADRSRRADQLVRTGLPHANGGARGARRRQGIRGDAEALWPGQARVLHLRPAVPPRPAARRTGRAVRADLRRQGRGRGRQRQRRSLGLPRRRETNHRSCGLHTDQPAAALLTDLASRGLLDSTLVIWGGEFGRTSDSQGAKGRDHNPNGFTIWMAGAGVKGGFHYGATDEFGYKAVTNKVHVNDLHATLLHLVGLNHEKLTYRFNGRDFRLTDVAGNVLTDILV